jgi:hypothetical protein
VTTNYSGTWDPTTLRPTLTLNPPANTLATLPAGSGSRAGWVRSTPSFTLSAVPTLIWFAPLTVGASSAMVVGICNASLASGATPGGDANSIGVLIPGSLDSGAITLNNALLGHAEAAVQGSPIAFAITTTTLWVSTDGGNTWNAGSGSGGSPYTLTGGYSISGLAAGPYFAVIDISATTGALNAALIYAPAPVPPPTPSPPNVPPSSVQQYVNPNAVYAGGLTCLQQIIPAYLYEEYADDDNLQAFWMAYNEYATQFLLWFNTLNLPIYTGGIISGALLDWVATGLYGYPRPTVTTGGHTSVDAINSTSINFMAINQRKVTSTEMLQGTTDDIYRRCLTWNFYKGDGFVFNMEWLKRRILRFLDGPNGISPVIDNTYAVSVTVAGPAFTVTIPTGNPTNVSLLNSLINSGACATPFQYSFVVGV